MIWSINSPMSSDRGCDISKALTSPHNSVYYNTFDASAGGLHQGRLKYLERRVKNRGIVKSKNAFNWVDNSQGTKVS